MIDFVPLLQNPFMLMFCAAAQFGIFTVIMAVLLGFDLNDAASIGIIAADTNVYFRSKYLTFKIHVYNGCRLLLHGVSSDYSTSSD